MLDQSPAIGREKSLKSLFNTGCLTYLQQNKSLHKISPYRISKIAERIKSCMQSKTHYG
jgi:hypothetical protein